MKKSVCEIALVWFALAITIVAGTINEPYWSKIMFPIAGLIMMIPQISSFVVKSKHKGSPAWSVSHVIDFALCFMLIAVLIVNIVRV